MLVDETLQSLIDFITNTPLVCGLFGLSDHVKIIEEGEHMYAYGFSFKKRGEYLLS